MEDYSWLLDPVAGLGGRDPTLLVCSAPAGAAPPPNMTRRNVEEEFPDFYARYRRICTKCDKYSFKKSYIFTFLPTQPSDHNIQEKRHCGEAGGEIWVERSLAGSAYRAEREEHDKELG
ncbi:hypothetical protein KSP40_PGU003104 [Platanthera guangdongensis]|uniref:Uncharacterized protein n=1 Tax=Platanthera guangdongensis TaxID=2320717 RepID=A0ABR2LK20_9ASPA